jgi:type IV secretory pathway TrbL component
MDKENLQLQVIPKQAGIRKRSLFCQIILISALTYFLIPALLFLAGLVYSGKIIQFIREYYKPGDISPENLVWVAVAGSFLYLASVAGILLFILKRKIGFYIFFLAAVVIFSMDLAFIDFDWIRYLIHSGFIFILGIAHFSKRCYH